MIRTPMSDGVDIRVVARPPVSSVRPCRTQPATWLAKPEHQPKFYKPTAKCSCNNPIGRTLPARPSLQQDAAVAPARKNIVEDRPAMRPAHNETECPTADSARRFSAQAAISTCHGSVACRRVELWLAFGRTLCCKCRTIISAGPLLGPLQVHGHAKDANRKPAMLKPKLNHPLAS